MGGRGGRRGRGGRTALTHELLGDAQAAVGAHDGQRGDVAVLDAVGGLLLHLGEYIANDLRVIVGRLLGPADVDGNVRELGPGQAVVHVVFEEVVFGSCM